VDWFLYKNVSVFSLKKWTASYSVKFLSDGNNIVSDTLINKNDIYEKIDTYTNMIELSKIFNHEIVVKITGEGMPNFEFIDLPDLKEYS
jgi:hypothetical protein